MTIRVLVVDDHPVVRGGLVGWLDAQPDLAVVGEAGDGQEALARVAETTPDVVLMDLRMPRMDGVAAIERLAVTHPAVRVLVLTTYDTDADIVRAVEAGASGYLLKDAPLPQLADAVRAAARGETVLAPPVAARLVSRLRAPAPESPTARELEVLAGVARVDQRRDRPGAVHRRGDGEDAPAAGVRQARRGRPDPRGARGRRAGPAAGSGQRLLSADRP